MAVTKKLLTDLDAGSVAKIKNLPNGSASGDAVNKSQLDAVQDDVDNVVSLTGMPTDSTSLGSFLGSTIGDNRDIKTALQDLETEVEKTSLTVKADSTAFLDITGNELSLKSLAITSVKVNTVETSLADYLSNEATEAATLEEGDVLILTQADSQYRSWVHNGNTNTGANQNLNFTRLQTDITPSAIRSYFTGGDGLAYDSATGDFDVNVDDSSLEIDSDALQVKADGIKDSHVDWGTGAGQVNAADIPLESYSWSRITNPANIGDALQKIDDDIAGIVSSGSVALNNGVASDGNNDGSIDVRVDDSGIEVDGSNNLSLKDAGVTTAIIADANVTLAKMADNSVDSRCYVDGSLEFVHLDAAAYSADLSSSASATELARADAAKAYADTKTKAFKATGQSLVADTSFTVTHNLGEKLCSCQVYDESNDKLVDCELELVSTTALKVKVTSSITASIVVIS